MLNFQTILNYIDAINLNANSILVQDKNDVKINNYHFLLHDIGKNKSMKYLHISCFIVIQIHNRPDNLKYLIISLKNTGFSSCLLIFSMDCYSEHVETIIDDVRFAPYIKLYYPLSHQLFAKEFKIEVESLFNKYSKLFLPEPHEAKEIRTRLAEPNRILWKSLGNWINSCEIEDSSAVTFKEYLLKNISHYLNITYSHVKTSIHKKFSLSLIKHHWWWKLNAIFSQITSINVTFSHPNLYQKQELIKNNKSLASIASNTISPNIIFYPDTATTNIIQIDPSKNKISDDTKKLHVNRSKLSDELIKLKSNDKARLSLSHFQGPVLFLEEDYYVSPDILNAMLYAYHMLYVPNKYQKEKFDERINKKAENMHHYNIKNDTSNDNTNYHYSVSYSQNTEYLFEWPLLSNKQHSLKHPEFLLQPHTNLLNIVNPTTYTHFLSTDLESVPVLPLLSMGNYAEKWLIVNSLPSIESIQKSLPNNNFQKYLRMILSNHDNLTKNMSKVLNLQRMLWRSSFHNMGMVLNRNLYNIFFADLKSAIDFCAYDDYNWDWTINHLFQSLATRFIIHAVYPELSRIFHMGICGVHQSPKKNSDPTQCSITNNVVTLKDNLDILYDSNVTFDDLNILPFDSLDLGFGDPNGGWNFEGNYDLCMKYSFVKKEEEKEF
ncbi:unnamed protein product [Gordionus sp. m RMFG-2023]